MFNKKKGMVEGQAKILQDEGPANGEPFRAETKAPTRLSALEDEIATYNRLAQQAIEELQAAENRGASQAELDELMQKVNDAIQKQEDLLTRMEEG